MSEINATGESSMPGYEIRRPRLAREFDEPCQRCGGSQNVATTERIIGGTAGAALVLLALSRKGLLSKVLLTALGGALLHRSITGHCYLYDALGFSTAQQHPARPEDYFQRGIHVETSQMIRATPESLYRFWRDFNNLPRIMGHVKSVQVLSNIRSRWTVAAPLGTSVFWEAEIIHDVPNELIAWSSVENSDVENAGTVIFTPRQEGDTEVRVVLDYIPPAGKIGTAFAKLFGQAPDMTIAKDLGKFKEMMEACESTGVEST